MNNKKMNKIGFTIVELVIVIAVIAILAGVMIPTFSGIIENAKESEAKQEAKAAYTATVAEDLEDGDPADAIAYNKAVKVHVGNYCVSISANGEISEVKPVTGDGKCDCQDTKFYTVVNGLLVADPADSPSGT